MKMILRWFPFGDDSVTLDQIRQIPEITGVAGCLPKIPVGEEWTAEDIAALKSTVIAAGLEMEVIESVNIHEDIKKGLPTRDRYIDNYIKTITNLGAAGVRVLCYNFMPVMDWARSDLAKPLPDGSTAMAYVHDEVVKMNPDLIAKAMAGQSRGYSLPGWEPERLSLMAADIEYYQSFTQEMYWSNMKYFLDAVIPAARAANVRMAIHPDDPPWPLFGLPKVITDAERIRVFLSLNDSPYNGITFCTGSLGVNGANDLPAMLREFGGRIHFAHIRNVRKLGEKDFEESAHPTASGSLDMFGIVKALYESGFDKRFTGYIRPDHGRMIWGERARPGYGLYDRALGAVYIEGLWEAIGKMGGHKDD
ncbi:MAG: mannonate dehydratase [Oscillospiraceae bacterium]|jgi:mannonate dehydratase|nr:mannonate dehydratase [Oscillospiraceae bacterium]